METIQDRSNWITIYYMLSSVLKLILRPPLTLTLFFKFVIITIVMMIIILINDNNNLLLLLLLSELKGENQISLFGIS